MKTETETDTLICQVSAMKEIIDEAGQGLLSQDVVNAISVHILEMYKSSDGRIEENN